MKLDVYGRVVVIVRGEHGWIAQYLGEDGTRRPADFVIPPDLGASQIIGYLDDLLHERAIPGRTGIRIIEPF